MTLQVIFKFKCWCLFYFMMNSVLLLFVSAFSVSAFSVYHWGNFALGVPGLWAPKDWQLLNHQTREDHDAQKHQCTDNFRWQEYFFFLKIREDAQVPDFMSVPLWSGRSLFITMQCLPCTYKPRWHLVHSRLGIKVMLHIFGHADSWRVYSYWVWILLAGSSYRIQTSLTFRTDLQPALRDTVSTTLKHGQNFSLPHSLV